MRRSLSWACVAIAFLLPAGTRLATGVHAAAPVVIAAPDRALFRLGDAARPFAWATAVADFNTDGNPDVAVADHIGRRINGYAYRLEFAIAGQAPRDVTFESTQDAVTVSVADVDRDNDLDVIVRAPLTGETVGVWLNDGRGNFTAGDVRQLPASIRALQSLDTTDPFVRFAAFDLSPRRADEGLTSTAEVAPSRSSRQSPLPQSNAVRSVWASSQTNPRAPPSAVLSVLS